MIEQMKMENPLWRLLAGEAESRRIIILIATNLLSMEAMLLFAVSIFGSCFPTYYIAQ